MVGPPQSVNIVSTPSFLSALATRWPPETRAASLLLGRSVSSAVVAVAVIDAGADAVLSAFMLPPTGSALLESRTRRAASGAKPLSSRASPAAEAARRGRRDNTVLVGVLGAARRKVPHAHRLQDKQADQRRKDIETHRNREHRTPAFGQSQG